MVKLKATEVAKKQKGVVAVRNNLNVKSAVASNESAGQTTERVVDDSAITSKVKTALAGDPRTKAHQVNVEGTLNLLEFSHHEGESHGRPVVFLYPSSIAVYGLPDLETKSRTQRVREDEWNTPTTMYGCNKLYCEHLGRYYARYYKQLAADTLPGRVDFRCVRFPGLISATTLPAGGTGY